jgi:hypothetical protein
MAKAISYTCDISGDPIPQGNNVSAEVYFGESTYLEFDLSPKYAASLINSLCEEIIAEKSKSELKILLNSMNIKFVVNDHSKD